MLKLATKFLPEQPAFERAHRAGFRCAELWLDAALLADRARWLPVARHYPFAYVPHFPNRLEQSPETLAHAAEVYRGLGCRAMVIHQAHADRYREPLLRLEPALRLAVENGRLDPAGFDAWAERNDGLALDVEHLWEHTLGDGPLPDLLRRLRDFLGRHAGKLRHVHLPGHLPGYGEHRPQYCARDLVFPVLSLLAEFGFDGLVVSEVNREYQTDNDLRMDVLHFDTWRALHDPLSGAATG